MFAGGHCLLVGVPGLAKTLMVRTLADALDLSLQPHPVHARPDAGRHHGHRGHPGGPRRPGTREFRFLPGPVFANVMLADEINRTPPKTQAALLEAMQEHQVTVGGKRHTLPEPFFVLATQNPIEQEGTYPLARSAARPLHVQDPCRLSVRRGGVRAGPQDDGRCTRLPVEKVLSARKSPICNTSCGGCRWPIT